MPLDGAVQAALGRVVGIVLGVVAALLAAGIYLEMDFSTLLNMDSEVLLGRCQWHWPTSRDAVSLPAARSAEVVARTGSVTTAWP